MKNISKFIFAIVLFAFSMVVLAEEGDFDFSLTDVTYDADAVEELELLQSDRADEYNSSLGLCKTLSYETKVEEGIDEIDTITVETARERDNTIEELEEEGYTTTATEKLHEAAVLNYEFNVINGRVRGATINGNEVSRFNGRTPNQITGSDEFIDYEDEDVVVTNEITSESSNISRRETIATAREAVARVQELSRLGYTVGRPVANNIFPTTTTISSASRLNRDTFANQLASENPNKEVIVITFTQLPNGRTTSTATTEAEANSAAAALSATGQYATVDVNEVVDTNKNNAIAVTEETEDEEYSWNDNETANEYDEDTNTGFIHHRRTSQEVQSTENLNVTVNGPKPRCDELLREYQREGYTNLVCTRDESGQGPNPGGPRPPQPGQNETWILTGEKTVTETVYTSFSQEFRYAVSYEVVAEYYRYLAVYNITDYTVSYRGTEGTITIKKSSADKYYEVDAERPEYTVSTTGIIEEDTACLNANEIVNTGIKENGLYELLAIFTATSLTTIFVRRKRKSN